VINHKVKHNLTCKA